MVLSKGEHLFDLLPVDLRRIPHRGQELGPDKEKCQFIISLSRVHLKQTWIICVRKPRSEKNSKPHQKTCAQTYRPDVFALCLHEYVKVHGYLNLYVLLWYKVATMQVLLKSVFHSFQVSEMWVAYARYF